MHPFIQKTLGGLSAQYYFRQFFFGLFFAALVLYGAFHDGRSVALGMLFFVTLSTLLYPYSRFVYERVVGFVMGENVFLVNALFMLIAKLITMSLCWFMAVFIAPLGLAYLYYHHSKAAR